MIEWSTSLDLNFLMVITAPVAGSFGATLADRARRGEGALDLRARSHCDACGTSIDWMDLVPLLGWLRLGGRARCCGARIPLHLPTAETGALVLTLWALVALPPQTPIIVLTGTVALAWVLLGLALIDLAVFRLPDVATIGLMAAGLSLSAIGLTGPIVEHALGALAGVVLLGAIAWGYRRLRGVDGLGLGDAKLLGAAGAWVGLAGLPTVILMGAMAGLAHGLVVARLNGTGARTAVPWGPGLALAFWVTWLYGPLVLR